MSIALSQVAVKFYNNSSCFFPLIEDSRKTSLVHSIAGMFVTSLSENPDQEEDGYQNTEDHENRQRKQSTVTKFVEVLFCDEEDEIEQSSSQIDYEKSFQLDQQGDATKQMIIRLQKLDRDRKKSLLVRVIDRLLSRSDHSQEGEMSTKSIVDHTLVDSENYRRQVSLHDIQRQDYREVDKEGPTWVSAKCRQRKMGIESSAGDVRLGLPNFGFEDERSEEIQEECSGDTPGHGTQKRSVTFSSSELPVQPLTNGNGEKDFEVDASVEKPPTVEDKSQGEDKETESVEDGRNPSASEGKPEPGSSTIHLAAKKRRPKTIKHWLRDPNLYKVCVF